MLYLVYKTTNKLNGKYYIGTHRTKNRDDGYLGSGTLLKRAIEKYGVNNFTKEILFEAKTPQEMFAKEKELVEVGTHTYNLKEGGFGGWDYVNQNYSPEKRLASVKKAGQATKGILRGRRLSTTHIKNMRDSLKGRKPTPGMTGKKHNTLSRNKMSVGHIGELNTNYGKRWIYHLETNESKLVKCESMPEGWVPGRKVIKKDTPVAQRQEAAGLEPV